jgi:hypothetical protein
VFKRLMKFVVFAAITAAVTKAVQGLTQSGAPHTATDTSTSGGADQWPPVPRRDEETS